jgi:uncharacterized membrane protein
MPNRVARRGTKNRLVQATCKLQSRWLCAAAVLAGCVGTPEVDLELGDQRETNEAGGRIEITVTLARRPEGVFTIYAVSSDESEANVSSPIQFDGQDWERPQSLTITGVDVDAADGDVSYEVSLYARLGQQPPRLLRTLTLVNVDDEIVRFDALGDLPGGEQASHLAALSAAGDVAVGWSSGANGDEAVRWSQDTGLIGLGGPSSRAGAVSPNGRIIAGSIDEPSYEGGRAGARWTDGAPYELLEGPRIPGNGPVSMMFVDGTAVRDDGHVYGTCIQYGAYGEPLACAFAAIGSVETFLLGHVYAADAAGNFAGTRQAERHAPYQSTATYNGAALPYPDGVVCSQMTGGCLAEARDFASGGPLIVGTAHVPASAADPATLIDTAFTFNGQEGVAASLPDLPGGAQASGAYAVSANGRVIAGFASDSAGQQAVVWLARTPSLLADLLRDAGGTLPAGFQLLDVRAISADGRTFAGNGTNADGAPEAFRVVLPRAP